MDSITYLVAAYAVVWVMMFLYLFSISRRERKIQRELIELNRIASRTGEERRGK